MFRYNANGEFNVPYGGISYNHKMMSPKIAYYQSQTLKERFKRTTIFNLDFEDFLTKQPPNERDFVFLDPPYDSEFSTYAKNAFTAEDQRRLADFMIHRCKARWMIVIKYTPFIYSLYDHDGLNIRMFDKKYLVSFMNRNDQKTEHLLITNY
jgi:DNA adenine methylase